MYREIKTRVVSFITKNELIVSGDKILIAVSGGMDSMFLLHLLYDLKDDLNIELAIAHINHNIRPNSKIDEKFVIEQAKEFGIPFYIKQLDFDKSSKQNIEAWARKNRYKQLKVIKNELNFDKIATAHHQNDQIETILQRLSEKAGIGGLRGIHKQIGTVIRPLLAISYDEIQISTKELNIRFIDDETNQDMSYKRNFFRHQIIPKWEEKYPNLGDAFQTIAENAEENQNILKYFFDQLRNSLISHNEKTDEIRINIKKSEQLPLKVFTAFVKYLIDENGWRKHNWNELRELLTKADIGKIYEINNFELLKDRKEWIIRPKFNVKQISVLIEVGNSIDIGDFTIAVSKVDKPVITSDASVEYIDSDKINNRKLIVRNWQEGDVFRPLGMAGNKKISDYLTDEKINSYAKQNQLVMTADDKIIWLCGHRISEIVKIDDKTRHYLELSFKSKVG